MTMRAYPRHKDSGVEWLGEIPEHWSCLPLKRRASHNDEVVDESTPPEEEILYVDISSVQAGEGIVNKEAMAFSAAPSRARRRVRDGDTIISTVRTYLRAAAAIRDPESNLIVSTGFAVVRPGPDLHSGFLAHLLTSAYFVEQVVARSVGVSYPAINASDLVRIVGLVPPLPEQAAIAAFLDRETAKIDALVAEQRRLIELLTEKRRAVISHAVTKGLNPDATMKHSGIDWLGEVPEHWEVWKLSRAFGVIGSGTTPSTSRHDYYDGGEIPWLITGDLNDGRLKETTKYVTQMALDDHSSLRCYPPGSLVFAMYGATIGKVAVLDIEATVNQACCVFGGESEISPEFLFYWFLGYKPQIVGLASGGGQPNLSQDTLRNIRVAAPSLSEQGQIVDYLNSASVELDDLTASAQAVVTLLTERRTALTSAAVTGKIDVRGSVPATPEEVGV